MAEDKKMIQPVVKGRVKEDTVLDKFTRVFFSADAKSVVEVIVEDFIVPGFKNMVVSAVETALYGAPTRRSRGSTHVSYDRMFDRDRRSGSSSRMDRRDRSTRSDRYDFSTIELDTRGEAEKVIFAMEDLLDKYDGEATVADLKSIVGISSNHIDNKWGWRDSRDFGIARSGRYWVLDFADPIYLDSRD